MCLKAIGTVVGALIAGLIGLVCAWWQRQQDGCYRFLAVINELDGDLDGCGHVDDRAMKFHSDSLVPLRSAVFAVQPFICKARFEKLLKLWHEYKDLKEQVATTAAMANRTAHELNYGKDSPTMPLYPDDLLRSYLKKFRKEASWYAKFF